MGSRADLDRALDVLLRFGAAMMHSGDAAFRVRDAMRRLAHALGIERLEVELSTGGLTATAWTGGETATLAREIGPPGVDASRIAALESLSLGAEAGLATETLEAELDRIEKAAPLHGLLPVALSMAVASTAFSYLNGGDLLATCAAGASGGIGQAARTLLSRRGFNQFAMTALCAVLASGLYCLTVISFGVHTFTFAHAIGFISSVLFLVPGFPLVAALLDLTQHQTRAGITRLFYGMLLTLSAACGMSMVAMLAGLAPAPAASPPGAIEPVAMLGRALACFAGGYGYGILFNNPRRTVFAVALLSMIGNEVRLGLHDLGLALPQATFFGALAVGLGASLVRGRLHAPRIALTVPSIIMMTPGLFAFQTVVFLNQGKALSAIEAAATCGFAVGGMAMGLVVSRFLTERQWRYER